MTIQANIKSIPDTTFDLITLDIIKSGLEGSHEIKEFDYTLLSTKEKKIVDDFTKLMLSKKS